MLDTKLLKNAAYAAIVVVQFILLALTRPKSSHEPVTPTRVACATISALCAVHILVMICTAALQQQNRGFIPILCIPAAVFILSTLTSLLPTAWSWTSAIVLDSVWVFVLVVGLIYRLQQPAPAST